MKVQHQEVKINSEVEVDTRSNLLPHLDYSLSLSLSDILRSPRVLTRGTQFSKEDEINLFAG